MITCKDCKWWVGHSYFKDRPPSSGSCTNRLTTGDCVEGIETHAYDETPSTSFGKNFGCIHGKAACVLIGEVEDGWYESKGWPIKVRNPPHNYIDPAIKEDRVLYTKYVKLQSRGKTISLEPDATNYLTKDIQRNLSKITDEELLSVIKYYEGIG